ncbi:MAG TPA: Tad domain-containing protein [Anaerolineales bacterium]|nr:Tad domain-containing protein [Anaerolineales bacterium]
MNRIASERGQALILIALGIVALVGFTALAVDGSMILSDRRHAQNAADTAAFAAALARINGEDYSAAGLARAASNGYDNNGTTNIVEVHLCSEAGVTCQLPLGAQLSQYVQVKITSYVNLYFARVLGRAQATNHVEAIAKAVVPETKHWFDGKALVSVMEGCRGGSNPNHPFTVGGNGTTIVNNSGIFVNSSCSIAFVDNGNSNIVLTDDGVCVVGGIQAGITGVTPPPQGGCGSQIDLDDFELPDPEAYCAQAGNITGSGGNYTATPGSFNTSGNQTFPDVSPSGTLKLQKGIYCLYNGISLNGNWTITTDLNGNGAHDPDTEGVLFYILDGDVTLNGGSTLNIHAISAGYPTTILNYLFYVPPSNDANVTITGNNGSSFVGTILAPTSHCILNGSGNTFSLDAQVICYDNTVTGSGHIDITFNDANNAVTSTKPSIELTK